MPQDFDQNKAWETFTSAFKSLDLSIQNQLKCLSQSQCEEYLELEARETDLLIAQTLLTLNKLRSAKFYQLRNLAFEQQTSMEAAIKSDKERRRNAARVKEREKYGKSLRGNEKAIFKEFNMTPAELIEFLKEEGVVREVKS